MKKFILLLLLGLFCLAPLQAQESKDDYLRRYSNLVDRVGPDGLGVETLLNKWEAAYPEDPNHMIARFATMTKPSSQRPFRLSAKPLPPPRTTWTGR